MHVGSGVVQRVCVVVGTGGGKFDSFSFVFMFVLWTKLVIFR
jgi:hypothetical protein